jgi:uncharacterized protein YqgC (DUF456 family)
MTIFFALLLVLALVLCWLLTLLGLPGNWLMAAIAAVYAWLGPAQGHLAIGWKTAVALVVLALLGEVVELLAGAVGVARAGGSKRGAAMALVGSILGGLVGVVVGVPIPLIGSLVAALLFAGLGAMIGAAWGEIWAGQAPGKTWRIAQRAFWGRLAGTLGKVILGALMIAVVLAAMLI